MMKRQIIFLALYSLSLFMFASQDRFGQIRGQVLLDGSRIPLPGVRVKVLGQIMETVSDEAGMFLLNELPVGTQALEFSCSDFATLTKTDIVVKVRQVTTIEIEMKFNLHYDVTVSAGYFPKKNEEPVSNTTFAYEEIRRSPASAGDVSRLLTVLPSVAKTNDMSNGLVVRGGCPLENSFYIDNIEVPTINHFPIKGSTSGAIGIINTNFLRDVTFFAGGFSVLYGDRLSSVTDMRFREGNREKLNLQADLNLTGFALAGEGPLGKNGSWLFSAKRSYFDLLTDGIAPRFGDLQGKLTFKLGTGHTLELLTLTGIDTLPLDKDKAIEEGWDNYGKLNSLETTTGLNWRALWRNGYSETSVAFSRTNYDARFQNPQTDNLIYGDETAEIEWKMRNVNYWRLNGRKQLQFGIEAKRQDYDYNMHFNSFTDAFGHQQPGFDIKNNLALNKAGAFANLSWNLFPALTVNAGLRADYTSISSPTTLSPRLSLSLSVGEKTTLTGAIGRFRQTIPLSILLMLDNRQNIKDPYANHYVLGVSQLLGDDIRLTIEGYDKEYGGFPLNPDYPDVFLADTIDSSELQIQTGSVISNGRARTYGLELTIQKKLARKFYGIACLSYFRSQYRNVAGAWRNRIYDNRFTFSYEGGYKPSNKLEFSARWTYAGGIPYTPFDLSASTLLNEGVLDYAQINAVRNPAYHSLNVRVDRHFHFSGSTLTTYLNFWNLYNRKNIAGRYWDSTKNQPSIQYQWGIMQLFGIEFSF